MTDSPRQGFPKKEAPALPSARQTTGPPPSLPQKSTRTPITSTNDKPPVNSVSSSPFLRNSTTGTTKDDKPKPAPVASPFLNKQTNDKPTPSPVSSPFLNKPKTTEDKPITSTPSWKKTTPTTEPIVSPKKEEPVRSSYTPEKTTPSPISSPFLNKKPTPEPAPVPFKKPTPPITEKRTPTPPVSEPVKKPEPFKYPTSEPVPFKKPSQYTESPASPKSPPVMSRLPPPEPVTEKPAPVPFKKPAPPVIEKGTPTPPVIEKPVEKPVEKPPVEDPKPVEFKKFVPPPPQTKKQPPQLPSSPPPSLSQSNNPIERLMAKQTAPEPEPVRVRDRTYSFKLPMYNELFMDDAQETFSFEPSYSEETFTFSYESTPEKPQRTISIARKPGEQGIDSLSEQEIENLFYNGIEQMGLNEEKKQALVARYPTLQSKKQFVNLYARVEGKLQK